MDLFAQFDNDFLQSIFKATKIHLKPLTGIVKGYHTLPYILVGADRAKGNGSIKLTGKITVSPKLIFSFNPMEEKFEQIFDEPEPLMDSSIVGRSFSFKTPARGTVNIKSQDLVIEKSKKPDSEMLNTVLEELSRREIINTGVILCPNPSFYPISLEKFIFSIIDKEFGE